MADDNTGTAPSTGTIREAATAFEQFLTHAEDGADNQNVEAQADEAADEAAEDAEQPETETEAPAEEEVEGEESGDEEDDEQPAGDKLYTVRVDGKEEQVTESEMIAGYQRHRDYTQKTQALSAERKELNALKAATSAERAEYAELLPKLRTALERELKEPDWEVLRAQDPARAAVEYDRFQEKRAALAKLKAEEDRVNKARQEEAEALRNQILIEEQERLLRRPELAHWKDPEKAAADAKLIAESMLEVGYAENELQIYDHRAMVMAWKAAQYDQLIKQRTVARQSVRDKVSKAPVAKPGSAGTNAPSAVRKAHERLAKTGSVKDAAALFESMF